MDIDIETVWKLALLLSAFLALFAVADILTCVIARRVYREKLEYQKKFVAQMKETDSNGHH